ncbi:MAG: galactose-1-phosphate uridylyltransferase [Candidatus Kapaibacterium sp.]
MKHQIRQNKATKQWVIYSPARGLRPDDFIKGKQKGAIPDFEENCPFCKGNESLLPEIKYEYIDSDGNWLTRSVPNKFPALSPDKTNERRQEGIYLTMQGYGIHEVVIETPKHNRNFPRMNIDEVEAVVNTYFRRYTALMEDNHNMSAIIFRNHGPGAGTSLEHPHSQILVTGIVPGDVRYREEEAQKYYDEWGSCVFCDMIAHELETGLRVIFENETFMAIVPYAAEVPYEVWIMPKRHQADFGEIKQEEINDMAQALKHVLTVIYFKLNDPDYNYVIYSAARYKTGEPQLHWYLKIRPRLTTRAGFEIGSGLSINPSFPERDAEFLRD